MNGIFYNQGQVCCAGSRLLVQENIYDKFIEKVKRRMATLRVGGSLEKNIDMAAVIDEAQRSRIEEFVEIGRGAGADVYQPTECPEEGCYYPPTLITNVHSTSRLVQEEIFGPVLVAQVSAAPKLPYVAEIAANFELVAAANFFAIFFFLFFSNAIDAPLPLRLTSLDAVLPHSQRGD